MSESNLDNIQNQPCPNSEDLGTESSLIDKLIQNAFDDTDIYPDEIPNLDLYMDQILTLIENGLSKNKRFEDEKILTKTMINNYSKENIITPIKGKKYSKKQIMQLLCIINLKPNLSLADIKSIVQANNHDTFDIEKSYYSYLELKSTIRENMIDLIKKQIGDAHNISNPETALALSLAISSGATYLRRLCEQICDTSKEER